MPYNFLTGDPIQSAVQSLRGSSFDPTGSASLENEVPRFRGDDLIFLNWGNSEEAQDFSHDNSLYADILGGLEGVTDHVDHLGIGTKAYGVVNDPDNQPETTQHNQTIARALNIDLTTAAPERSKLVARKIVQEHEQTLAREVPNWSALTPESRVFMLDAKYNTNQTFVDLPIALEEYQNNPTKANLKKVGTESRRKAGGVYSKGMDNRVAKIMKARGLINNIDEARDLGLPLASSS
jgi:hypothetical protein